MTSIQERVRDECYHAHVLLFLSLYSRRSNQFVTISEKLTLRCEVHAETLVK
jgi:hypothetical protein